MKKLFGIIKRNIIYYNTKLYFYNNKHRDLNWFRRKKIEVGKWYHMSDSNFWHNNLSFIRIVKKEKNKFLGHMYLNISKDTYNNIKNRLEVAYEYGIQDDRIETVYHLLPFKFFHAVYNNFPPYNKKKTRFTRHVIVSFPRGLEEPIINSIEVVDAYPTYKEVWLDKKGNVLGMRI